MTEYPKYQFLLSKAFALSYMGTDMKAIAYRAQMGDVTDISQAVAMSYMGTPVFDTLYLDTKGINLRIDTALLNITMTKNIVKTAISGMNGTVKEYISDGDYQLNIKGMIVSENGNYPDADVSDLLAILKKASTIGVNSVFLNLVGIDEIVIESYTLSQQEGYENVQLFEISAISDKPAEIILNKDL